MNLKIVQNQMTKKIKMDIKIVQNGHKNSLMNKKKVQLDIKIVQMK